MAALVFKVLLRAALAVLAAVPPDRYEAMITWLLKWLSDLVERLPGKHVVGTPLERFRIR